ncbi:hypothetical protein LCGC14_0823280 [marine sediment metagenome]|uniref:Uncharacterized protein n=1 Tax=marine sediment metagenome TaxID=412755 RepID=A0A0F9PMT0_9ZZZZ|nr:hypothetical protein [Candidatus Scalindua sp.]
MMSIKDRILMFLFPWRRIRYIKAQFRKEDAEAIMAIPDMGESLLKHLRYAREKAEKERIKHHKKLGIFE